MLGQRRRAARPPRPGGPARTAPPSRAPSRRGRRAARRARRGPARRARRRRSAGRRAWPCRRRARPGRRAARSASVRLPAPSRPSITTSRPTGADPVSPGAAGGGRRSPSVRPSPANASGVGQPPAGDAARRRAHRSVRATVVERPHVHVTVARASTRTRSPSKLTSARRRLVRRARTSCRDPRGGPAPSSAPLPDVVVVAADDRDHAQRCRRPGGPRAEVAVVAPISARDVTAVAQAGPATPRPASRATCASN